jgi:hypothetical protein
MNSDERSAIFLLAMQVGALNGERLSNEDIFLIKKISINIFGKEGINTGDDFAEKIKSGEINETTSINLLKHLNEKEKTQCMAICIAAAYVDDDVSELQEQYLGIINEEWDINMDEAIKLYLQNKDF